MSAPPAEPASVFVPVGGSFSARLAKRVSSAQATLDLSFDLEAPGRLAFEPGQFLTMFLPNEQSEGPTLKRSYSLASAGSPTDVLRFIVRLVPDGAASRAILALPLGATVAFTGPHGYFTLAPEHAGDVVFGVTGTGMAALFPMLTKLARQPNKGRRVLFWGLRHEDDVFGLTEVEALCAAAETSLRLFLSAPSAGSVVSRGRITEPLLDTLPSLQAPTFYLVGNGAMIADLKRELVARGVNRKTHIRTEAFFD